MEEPRTTAAASSSSPPSYQADAGVRSILPALKTFPTNEIAIIGCHALNLARRTCEYDLLVVSPDPIPHKYVRVGEACARITFRSERDVRRPDPDLAMVLAHAVPLRDSSLLLATATADCKRSFKANCKRTAEARLAASLKSLARVDELLAERGASREGEERTGEADLSLMTAARDFAYADLLMNGRMPAPSHLLGQVKALPRKRPSSSFKPWADAFGLELASRVSCENRFEGLSVIYDVLRTSSVGSPEEAIQFGRYQDLEAVRVIEAKAGELLGSMQSTECYSYLGQEVVQTLLDLYRLHASRLSAEEDYSRVVRALTTGPDRLISEDVLRLLGLVRGPEVIGSATSSLKASVSSLAKRI